MTDATVPKPSLLFVTVSLAVLAACGAANAFGIASMFVTWDPCAVISGLILLPIPFALGVQQYRGTFRRNASAAFSSAVISLIFGGVALLAFAAMLDQLLFAYADRIPWQVLLPMLGVGGALCFAGVLNFRRNRRLVRGAAGTAHVRVPWYRSLRDVVAGIAAIAFVAGLATYFVQTTPPQFAVGVSRDEAPVSLPEGASDVSYCRGHRGTVAYEFTIDEAGFVSWVESGIGSIESEAAGVRLEPIDGFHRIKRCFYLASGTEGPESAEISDGLSYTWRKEDRGVYAAFDRVTGRAYYFAHFH